MVATTACTCCTWEPRTRFCPSTPARCPLSTLERSGRLSTTATLGCGRRPEAARTSRRSSWTLASQQPAARRAAHLLVDRFPRREVAGQPSARRTRAHDRAHRIEDLTPLVAPWRCGLGQQAQIGRDERPVFITDITDITDITGRGASVHPPILRARR